jgi:hypothetical protein
MSSAVPSVLRPCPHPPCWLVLTALELEPRLQSVGVNLELNVTNRAIMIATTPRTIAPPGPGGGARGGPLYGPPPGCWTAKPLGRRWREVAHQVAQGGFMPRVAASACWHPAAGTTWCTLPGWASAERQCRRHPGRQRLPPTYPPLPCAHLPAPPALAPAVLRQAPARAAQGGGAAAARRAEGGQGGEQAAAGAAQLQGAHAGGLGRAGGEGALCVCCLPATAAGLGLPAWRRNCQQLCCPAGACTELGGPCPLSCGLLPSGAFPRAHTTPPTQEENMVSNKDIQEKYRDFNDYEDDFM